MAALTFAQMTTRLNTKLSDSTDKTFSSSEKNEFLTSAYDDPEVYYIGRDTSLTTVADQNAYTVPSGFGEITDIFFDTLDDGVGNRVERNSYDIVDGTIYFHNIRSMPTGYNIIIFGKKDVAITDTMPESLQTYVLTLAQLEAYEFMKNKYATRFLKNDVSMGELLSAIGQLEQKAGSLRKNLANRREIAV